MLNAGQLLSTTTSSSTFFQKILKVLSDLGGFIGNKFESLQIITIASFALFIAGVVICCLFVSRTYESRLLKHVTGFNKYFKKNPYINEDNLVEVNQKFKQVPKTLRYCWQEYMLNRDRQPSEYINSVSCIDQPTRSSAYKNLSNTVLFITIMIAVLTMFANFVCVFSASGATTGDMAAVPDMESWFVILLFPLLYVFLGLFIVAFMKLYESSRYADLYYEFHEFERYLNKACSTMPAFVDYEVLFDAKEIKEAIPVLQEYLEKRALQEQREAEEAELNANHFENFNFEPVGVESSLLLDRAMLEGEKYFSFKRNLTERINAKENEIANYQKKFDEVTKEYDRKSQAVRESMASLNEQLNATSVKIEANYLKKKYNEEQQKQQQLEKDYEYSQVNFYKQQQELEEEVLQLRAQIKERKEQVEENMMSECRNYSNKVWGEINKTLQAQQEPIIKEKEERSRILQEEIDKMTLLIADQDADIKAKQEYILKLEQDIKVRIAEIEAINNVRDYFNTPEFRQRVSEKKKRRRDESDFSDEQEYVSEEPKANTIATILNSDNRDEKMKQEENELLSKLKEANLANSEYAKEIEEIKERERTAAENEVNPFASFTNLQKNIEEAENKEKEEALKQQQEEAQQNEQQAQEEAPQAEVVENNEPAQEEQAPAEEVPAQEESQSEPVVEQESAPAQEEAPKRTSLQSLLNSAKNFKK